MRALIDDSIVPDPWRPQTGDVYHRLAEGRRRGMVVRCVWGDGTIDVFLPDGSEKRITELDLRALIVCLGMLPAGLMRSEELGT